MKWIWFKVKVPKSFICIQRQSHHVQSINIQCFRTIYSISSLVCNLHSKHFHGANLSFLKFNDHRYTKWHCSSCRVWHWRLRNDLTWNTKLFLSALSCGSRWAHAYVSSWCDKTFIYIENEREKKKSFVVMNRRDINRVLSLIKTHHNSSEEKCLPISHKASTEFSAL